jgi:hypothetical protein
MEDAELREWESRPDASGYDIPIWSAVGIHELDHEFTRLADLYLASKPTRRAAIRAAFTGKLDTLDDLWRYVRRVGLLIQSADVAWLRRGLAIAAVEGGRADFRDTLMSLVLLRYAAERVGIDPRPCFDEAIELAAPESSGLFENVRDHSDFEMRYTVASFGPPSG